MSLLVPMALVLLAAVPLLLWLAMRARQPRAVEVGTLMLWLRVANAAAVAQRRSRRLDVLALLAAAACLLAALGAAGPALSLAAPALTVGVYIECLAPGGDEPGLEELFQRAEQAAPGARLRFWCSAPLGDGAPGQVHQIQPGPPEAEIAQFEAASSGLSGRLLFVAEPGAQAGRVGLVLPRAERDRPGVIFEVRSEQDLLFVRMSDGPAPQVEGASFRGAGSRDGELERQYQARAPQVRLASAGQNILLRRREFSVGAGPDWSDPRHQALLAALGPPGTGQAAECWLGARDQRPAVRINQGEAADMTGAEAAFDPAQALFQELPLDGIELLHSGRLIPAREGVRPLASARRGTGIIGHLVTLSADGKVLDFAGDPFSDSSLSAAALLLDNAVGLVTGTRPSERPLYHLEGDPLPSRRQAMAGPFEPQGELLLAGAADESRDLTAWILALGAVAALGAAGLALYRR